MKNTSLQRISKASELLTVKNGQLIQSKDFAARVRFACALQEELDTFWSDVKEIMESNDIRESKADVVLKLVPQRRLSAQKGCRAEFMKQTLDTKKVRDWQADHSGKLPAFVKETVTNRLTKDIK